MTEHFRNRVLFFAATLCGLWLLFELGSHLFVETLWFQELDYLSVFQKRFLSQLGLFFIGIILSSAFLLGNIFLARRLITRNYVKKTERFWGKVPLRLPWLLSFSLVMGLIVGLILVNYLDAAYGVWQTDFNLAKISSPLPASFELQSAIAMVIRLSGQTWQLGFVGGIALLILVQPEFVLIAISGCMSLACGIVMAANWSAFFGYLYQTNFDQAEPLFGNNISFYVFTLPIQELLHFCFFGLCWYALIAVILLYLLANNNLSEGKFTGFTQAQSRHLYALGCVVMLMTTLHHWLARYALLYSPGGLIYGAGYTDVKVQIPVETILTFFSLGVALWFLFKAVFISPPSFKKQRQFEHKNKKLIYPYISLRESLNKGRQSGLKPGETQTKKYPYYLFLILGTYLATVSIGSFLLPVAVDVFRVQPNELALERDYIERSIALTRSAFALDKVEVKTFNPVNQLTFEKLTQNLLTIDNIRLWDTRPLLQTNRQLQQIRLYYRFLDADIDRYTLQGEQSSSVITDLIENKVQDNNNLASKQQLIVAPRELDYSEVPQEAQTWVNKHLVYTHGYGFTISPVNQVDEGGLPFYYVKDIGTVEDQGALRTSSPAIRESIPTANPRIYYGELTDNYVMTSTKVQELDFPSGEGNVYNTYDGTGGIRIGNYGRRLMFARYLKDWQMLFTRNFTPQTKLLFRRNIKERIRTIAPFLRYDHDPYLVVADTQPEPSSPQSENTDSVPGQSYLYWIIDGYTTSDRYPYSEPGEDPFNYIRNSVKVVIDAYNGEVSFFIADGDDPIIQTWSKIFPELFQPLSAMPNSLRTHIRYPADLFRVQSERLLTYHMTDSQVFYNREDKWEIPQEIYGDKSQPVNPYFLIMRLPTEVEEEFILFLPFTPTSRNNLIAWLAGRSDGEQYGKVLLYRFPKQKLVYGIDQVEALINQDPVISQEISLWNNQGATVVQGNLLVIPIEESLIYVEPLYLEAEQNSLPTLIRVIVVYDNRIIMASDLAEALKAIFQPKQDVDESAIIRSVD